MDRQEQIEQLEALRNAYETILEVEDANSHNAIQSFHAWHTSAIEFFVDVLGEEDPLLEKFQPEGLGGNGYMLQNVYHSILGTYSKLKIKAKKMESPQTKTDIAGLNEYKSKKIFISHSSKDKKFAEALIIMLNSLGFHEGEIFCSSVPGYWIKKGNFFQVIKEQFEHNDLYVIFIQSPRFYASPVSLNEMGAAWALHSEYYSFMTRDMEYDQMSAVVNNHEIACKVDNDDAKGRLNDWMLELLSYFGKQPIRDLSIWENHRDAFLQTVRRLSYKRVIKNPESEPSASKPTLTEKDEELLKEWVDSGDSYMYNAEYMGGGDIILGNANHPYTTGREEAQWDAFFKRLETMGFIESTSMGDNSARYKLTEYAYTYFEK